MSNHSVDKTTGSAAPAEAPAQSAATAETCTTPTPAACETPAKKEPSANTANDACKVASEQTDGSGTAAAERTATRDEPQKQQDEEGTKCAEADENKPDYLAKNPNLNKLFDRLPAIIAKADHGEMWGVILKDDYNDAPTINVLIKFLRANEGHVKPAEDQLVKALKWRRLIDPIGLFENHCFNADKFEGLGYVTKYKESETKDLVVNWNVYGSVKDFDATFGDFDEFIKWRIALLESSLVDLKLSESTSVLDYAGEDPYQVVQVHDYQNVSYMRINPKARAATKKTIDIFSMAYPELLRESFFINVPAFMSGVFTVLRAFAGKNTNRKFHPITNGATLAREFPDSAIEFPKAYGGEGAELKESRQRLKLVTPEPNPEPESSNQEQTQTERNHEQGHDKTVATESAAPASGAASPTPA